MYELLLIVANTNLHIFEWCEFMLLAGYVPSEDNHITDKTLNSKYVSFK